MCKHLLKRRFFANLSLTFIVIPFISVTAFLEDAKPFEAKMALNYTLSDEGQVIENKAPQIDHKAPILISQNAVLAARNPKTASDKQFKGSYLNSYPTYLSGKKIVVLATAYSSTVDQTDSSPFITASGIHVHNGTLAANFLPFGTRVKIPAHFGDKVFIVEDRMKSNEKIDVWYPSREEALHFGARRVEIEIQ